MVTAVGSGDQRAVARAVDRHAEAVARDMRLRVPEGKRRQVRRVVDKMLFNFRNVGFIHLLYPEAPIIHCVRGFWDVLFSCYKHKFEDAGLEWSMSVPDLVRFLAAYRQFMQHWEAVLPGRILHVQYEDLVRDPEGQVRRILAHCGLAWEDQVLRFHEARATVVHTFSAQQVRSEIYAHAVRSSARYGPWLRALAEQSPGFRTLGIATTTGGGDDADVSLDWVTGLASQRVRLPGAAVERAAAAVAPSGGTPSDASGGDGRGEGGDHPAEVGTLRLRLKEALEDEDFEEAKVIKVQLQKLLGGAGRS